MDILAAVEENKEVKIVNRSTCDFATMHPGVFEGYLQKLGLDKYIIEDCLFEPRDRWDSLLEYWEWRSLPHLKNK